MKLLSLFFLFFFSANCNAQTDYFPPLNSDQWETTPLSELNWCEPNVDEMLDYLEENETKAFIILKDGKIVIEEYFGTFSADSSWYWASAGKNLTAFMIGMAQEQGYLNLEDSTTDYLGEGWTNCDPEEESNITIWNQLTMTSGLDDGVSDIFCTDPECLTCLEPPGDRWAYHNGPYTVLDGVIEAATGTNLNVFVYNEITNSTGITGVFLPVDYNNVFFSKPRSFARFGHLLLNEGNWGDEVLLEDNDYFQSMTSSSQDLNQSYGYLTWLNGQDSFMMPSLQAVFTGSVIPNAPNDMYAALGKNGQILNVVPSSGLVVIRMGNAPGNGDLVPFIFNNTIWQYINDLECDPLNLEEKVSIDLKIYPNPASDFVFLEFNSKSDFSVSVINSIGNELFSLVNQKKIDTSALPPGSYQVVLKTTDSVISKNLIIF